LARLSLAIDSYYANTHYYPEKLELLEKNANNSDEWKGPYIKHSRLKDSWGSEYIYRLENSRFTLISYEADQKEGGINKNSDQIVRQDMGLGLSGTVVIHAPS